MSATESKKSDQPSQSPKPTNEFEDGRKVPPYAWKQSVRDWWNQSWSKKYSDGIVETRLLSFLPFFPESDGRRTAKLIDTDIGDGNYIHEFYIENSEKPESENAKALTASPVKDIVLIHGYAASLGLFFDNFDRLSSIPGVRVHAIDMLGFGFSSRPDYPNFKHGTVAEIRQNEDWFLDSIEEWRKRRGIENFVLVGHSFGGYLSCAYAMKYNQRNNNESNQSMIQKLVLLSPVGVERHENSLLKDTEHPPSQVSSSECLAENSSQPRVSISREITSNQEDIVTGSGSQSGSSGTLNDGIANNTTHLDKPETPTGEADNADEADKKSKSFRSKIVPWLWEKHVSPFSIMRKAGPARSKIISGWTTHRFSHIFYTNPEKFQCIHDYFYRIFNAAGSGEYAITRVLGYGALARLPLLDRCPEKFVKMNLPTLWLYGDKDWMNKDAGEEMTKEINGLCKAESKPELAEFGIINNAGHHLYLDNPDEFADTLIGFLNK
ncbi:hypothetical protein JCM33374_g405 [Metschnikowia sp. JCM 33374]|nr:hypothetical protein JCM33374_g405 [Metschnikowia sp. JCM 33374]